MPLLIDLAFGTHPVVFDALVQIVRCDPGLSTVEPNPLVLQVTYTPQRYQVAETTMSDRILALVNSPTLVVIAGVDSTFVIPGETVPIKKYTGGLCKPFVTSTPFIGIWIDVTDAGGQFYVIHDTAGLDIYEPREVILYHELSHAFHTINGDAPQSDRDQEIQAVADENTYRAAVGLPARHASDHYGKVGTPSHGGVTGVTRCTPPGFNWDCIVASAAVGAPYAPQVVALRQAKHKYRCLSL